MRAHQSEPAVAIFRQKISSFSTAFRLQPCPSGSAVQLTTTLPTTLKFAFLSPQCPHHPRVDTATLSLPRSDECVARAVTHDVPVCCWPESRLVFIGLKPASSSLLVGSLRSHLATSHRHTTHACVPMPHRVGSLAIGIACQHTAAVHWCQHEHVARHRRTPVPRVYTRVCSETTE